MLLGMIPWGPPSPHLPHCLQLLHRGPKPFSSWSIRREMGRLSAVQCLGCAEPRGLGLPIEPGDNPQM